MKIQIETKIFMVLILTLIILSHYDLQSTVKETEIRKTILNESQIEITKTFKDESSDTKIIYFVTQFDKRSRGKKNIKYGPGFFQKSKSFKNQRKAHCSTVVAVTVPMSFEIAC